MGLFSSRHSHFTVLLAGLDQGGKSTFLWRLKSDRRSNLRERYPTAGFDIQEIKTNYEHLMLRVIDTGGQGRYRQLWHQYATEADAIIFVIDAADTSRFCVVKDEMAQLIRNPSVRQVPLLILANKSDVVEAVSPAELGRVLDIQSIVNQKMNWAVFPVSAITGDGIQEAEQWLAQSLIKNA